MPHRRNRSGAGRVDGGGVELGTLDGGTSAEFDITGADEAAGPVLEACGV